MKQINEAPGAYNLKRFINTQELAKLLNVNHDTATRLCRDGRLHDSGIGIVKLGDNTAQYRISLNDLESAIGKRGSVTADEAAKTLDLNPRTVKTMCADGRLKCLKCGSGRGTLWRVSVEALEEMTKGQNNDE